MRNKVLLGLLCGLLSFPLFSSTINELLPEEKKSVELFQTFSPKVVYVHRLKKIPKHPFAKDRIPNGAGSGVIWDDKGHVVTNFHVIKGADDLAITIGSMTVPAKVVGAEPRKDIAVLQITNPKAVALLKSFVPFQLAHSRDLLVGQTVLAIGNPYGLDHTLTVGVVSALGRKVPGVGGVTIHQMIQTDAAINPGNSGGPLLDTKGRLIGLNTAIYSNSGSSAGIGFAVPADDLERIVPQLINKGHVVLSGIGIQRVEVGLSKRLGVTKGILIGEVIANTPAKQAGLQGTSWDKFGRVRLGDIIIAVNGQAVNNYDVLYHLLTQVKVGEQITVTVNRHNRSMNFKMKTIDITGL